MDDRIAVLLDTDIGSDIDDALALAYLLRQPKCELLGITVVSGDVEKRAAIAEVVCNEFGRPHMPIHLGASAPLGNGPGQPNVPHYDAIKHLPHRPIHQKDAVDYLRSTIRSRPHEIVLLSIGPLTNLAILFALDPEIPHLLRGTVSMAGSFFRNDDGEWNCTCDPEAATAVFRRSANHTLVGLDVTLRCTMSPEEVREKFQNPPLDVLLAMAEKWFQGANKITFHDPLAAALIFEPALCTLQSATIGVDSHGRTRVTHPEGPHSVANGVNVDAFFTEYFSRL
jgi:inosine-uridine nucleoside N-ribohydrolase